MEKRSESSLRFKKHSWIASVAVSIFVLLKLTGCRAPQQTYLPSRTGLHLSAHDRLLILAPHPDDEVLGCAGVIQQAIAMRLPVRVVFLTYGDNNQWSFVVYRHHPVISPQSIQKMGMVRHDEAIAAADVLGLPAGQLTFLGYPDFGTLHIWTDHWDSQPPFKSMLTRVRSVPYANAFRPGAKYKGEEVVRDLTALIREFRPTKIFVSHPGDHMPDHLALYLFTQVALWDLEPELKPAVYPYFIHMAHWPRPKGYRPTEELAPPARFQSQILWISQPLSKTELARKLEAIKAHRSQYAASAKYLLSFVRPNELFGDFPAITLGANTSQTLSESRLSISEQEASEQLTNTERAAFVGLETRFIKREGDELVLSFEFSRPLAQAVGSSIYLFGYRKDEPFSQMPKLHVKLSAVSHAVFDQDRELQKDVIRLERRPKSITIHVPLSLLKEPQRILSSARTYLGEIPLDWASWRILELTAS